MPDLDFNSAEVPPADSFDPIPAGWYTVTVEESKLKPTKDGSGEYLELTLEVIDGQYTGRKLWDRLNLKNANEQTVQIARRQLSALTIACRKVAIKRTEELHAVPILAKVAVREARGDFDATNTIKGYKPTEAAQAARASDANVAPKAQGQASSVPWGKK